MTWLQVAMLAACFIAVVAVLAAPSLPVQVGLSLAVLLVVASLVMMRAGRTLDAAWVIVPAIYLVAPLEAQLAATGSPISMAELAVLAPIPFVIGALLVRSDARDRLVLLAPLLVLAGLALLSLAWSPDVPYGLRKLTLWIATGILPCAFILILASPDRPVSWRLVLVFATVFSVALLLTGSTNTAEFPGRLTFQYANPIWVARAAVIGVLIALFGPFPRLVKLVVIPPMLLAAHLTDSLGPTLGLVIGGIAGSIALIRIRTASGPRSGLVLVALGLSAAAAFVLAMSVALSTSQTTLSPVVGDPNVTGRVVFLDVAIQMFSEAPLLGQGLGAFALAGFEDFYPHNLFAEVASEVGLLGLAALIAWFALALRSAAGSPLLVALVIATSVFALFSGSVASNAEFWIFTGVALATGHGWYRIRREAPASTQTDPSSPPPAAVTDFA